MALSSKRSPSPLSLSSRPNPNSRTPEISSSARRSFNSSPFSKLLIASNSSSADFGLRKSISKEELVGLLDYEQKENEKDQNQKPERVRSASKGTKNFMSPTISAASKMSATPRKKILAERNDPMRTSVSLSEGKIIPLTSPHLSDFEEENIATKVDMGSMKNQQKTKSHTVTFDEKIELIPDPVFNFQPPSKLNFLESSSSITVESNSANFDASSKPVLAPLDADPLIPLHNPEMNSVSESASMVRIESDVANVFYSSSKPKPRSSETTSIVRIESDVADVFNSSSKPKPPCSESTSIVRIESDVADVFYSSSKPKPPCSSSPAIVPLDADPSLPPYDPEKNYLSPRPQFRCYKPNPQIDVTQLEVIFSSESNEDTQSEDLSSVELVSSEDELLLLDSKSIDTHESDFVVEARSSSKCRLFRKSKSISLILVFVIACLSMSITDTPIDDPLVLKYQTYHILYEPSLVRNFRLWSANSVSYFSNLIHSLRDHTLPYIYDPSAFTEFAEVILEAVARNVRIWSADSVSYFSKLVHNFREVGNDVGHLPFNNSTFLGEDAVYSDDYCWIDHDEEGEKLKSDFVKAEEVKIILNHVEDRNKVEMASSEMLEENGDMVLEEKAEEVILNHGDEERKEVKVLFDEKLEENTDVVVLEEAMQLTLLAKVIVEAETEFVQEATENENLEAEAVTESVFGQEVIQYKISEAIIHEVPESEIETTSEIENTEEENVFDPKNLQSYSSDTNSQSIESLDSSTLGGVKEKFQPQMVLGITVFVLILSATAVLIYSKKSKPTIRISELPAEQAMAKKMTSTPSDNQQQLPSRNLATEVDMIGESCPSEMSSIQRSNWGFGGTDEIQSQERKTKKYSRRESLASSSSEYSMGGSPSYGSFTTYEKLHAKHGSGEEEEVVTPVRRSSRIRSIQVPSPMFQKA